MHEIHTQEDYVKAINDPGIQVMLFTTKWCGDCMFIKPFMPSIEQKFSNVTFHQVDRDELMSLAQELEIMGIPSFVAYKDGAEITRFVSSLRKTQKEIEDYIEMTIAKGENK